MEYIAAFDIGTTAVKGALCRTDGKLEFSESVEISTIFSGPKGEYKEQDPDSWYEAFCQISSRFFQGAPGREGIEPKDILAIVMSGQMQDLIPLDCNLRPVGNAILYSDGRGEGQSQSIKAALGEDYLERVTGNHYDGSLSFPKLIWLREKDPDRFQRIGKVLISSKDYVNGRLTGRACGDATACATAGAMDIHKKCWDPAILEWGGIPLEWMPEILASHEEAGRVTPLAAKETGYGPGTPVYTGVGDAGATTLASGISDLGEYNINLGTSGWVATVSADVLPARMGVFNLAAMPADKYINVVPFLNAGNVHKWVTGLFSREEGGADYAYMDRLLEATEAGSQGVLFLPYLCGERFPVMDAEIRGAFLGLSPETGRGHMARACLEGVAFSIRQGIESIGVPPKKISIIGGGGRVSVWCQILADVLNHPVYVYKDSEILPSLAISSAALLGQGRISGYSQFTDSLQEEGHSIEYQPMEAHVKIYDGCYEKYRQIYPALRRLEDFERA